MRSVRRSLAAAACLPLLVVAVAGCGGGDPAPIVAEPPPSSSAPASPSASAEPEPWEVRSKAGAVAFVEHWVEVFNEAGATGETEGLEAVSGPDCTSCSQLIDQITRMYSSGTRVESAGWQVLVTEAVASQQKAPFDIAVRIKRPPQRVIDADGNLMKFSGSTQTYGVVVAWNGDSWQLNRFNQIA